MASPYGLAPSVEKAPTGLKAPAFTVKTSISPAGEPWPPRNRKFPDSFMLIGIIPIGIGDPTGVKAPEPESMENTATSSEPASAVYRNPPDGSMVSSIGVVPPVL